jgi:hypothetical protein
MGAVYLSIPLFLVMIVIAVTPVLYGTLKHRQWEEAELASWAQPVSARRQAVPASIPITTEVPDSGPHKPGTREEAMAALARLERLRDYFEKELDRLRLHSESAAGIPAEAADF